MKKTGLLIFFLSFIIIGKIKAVTSIDSVNVEPFGKVFVYKQAGIPENVVIMISGDGGWKYGVVDFARTFSELNSIVIGVDILRYYRYLRKSSEDCYIVSADFVKLATEIEKIYNFPEYKPAVIMGYSSGATLVYGILAQARPGTFVGGISLGFCPDIELPKMLCQINGVSEKVLVPGKSFYLNPDARLGNKWMILHGKMDKVCSYPDVEDFVKKTTDAELITLPKVGHGFARWSDFMPQWKDAYMRLIAPPEVEKTAEVNPDILKKIPVVITAARARNKDKPIALLISGDGGWYGFEQSIADYLSKQDIPTLGLDSKKYFWKRRSPEETSSDMETLLNYYSKEWGNERFILIGYSLGAEIVPFIVNRMTDQMKSRIASAVLLSPQTHTDFEVHITNMIGIGNRQNTYNVMEEIIKMQSVPTLIIFGDGEKSKVPELLAGTSAKIRMIPGDHHYKFNLPLIITTMKDNNAF